MNPLTGKMEDNGTSIVDVTDPKESKYLAKIPGDPRTPGPGESGGAQMTRVCDGSELPRASKNKVYLLRAPHFLPRSMGCVRSRVAEPSDCHRERLERYAQELLGSDSGIAYLVSRRARLAHSAHGAGLRPGRSVGATTRSQFRIARPTTRRDEASAYRHARRDFHAGKGNRIYAGYGTNGKGMIEILDRDMLIHGPKDPTDANLKIAHGRRGSICRRTSARTTTFLDALGVDVPELAKWGPAISKLDFLVIVGETTDNECYAPEEMMHISTSPRKRASSAFQPTRARSERQFLQPWRPFRHALDEREHVTGLLQTHHLRGLL